MREHEEVTCDGVGWISDDTSYAKRVAPLSPESFEAAW